MDALSSNSGISEVAIMKSTQVGFTTVAENFLGYLIDVAPGPSLYVLPTAELAKDFSKQKLAPTIEETPRLREKVSEKRTKDSGNTIAVKEFPGGILFLIGSNSGAGFRQRSIRYLILDDLDGYELDVAGEGDPADLARKRTDTFSSRKKILEISTPTVKGVSRIEKSFEEGSQAYYEVPCPHCGGLQRLEWGERDADFGLRFTYDDDYRVTDVWYQCSHCHARIDEHNKTVMLNAGQWVHTYPDRPKKSYQISSLYSPIGWVSWRQIVVEFLEAKKSPMRLKVWRNTRLGLPYESTGDQPDWIGLKARCEPYEMLTVPEGGNVLTAGVDVQDDRLAVVIRAWGHQEESWLVWTGELYGDTANLDGDAWTQLDALLTREYSGHRIAAMAIDSGGHRTQEVYTWCRVRAMLRVFPTKGSSSFGRPILAGPPSPQDVTWQGQRIKDGISLQAVGTDTAKGTIYGRLQLTAKGPGTYHWPIGTSDEYFRQLTAEKLVTTIGKTGYPVQQWQMIGQHNEALDCEVLALAAAMRLGVHVQDLRTERAEVVRHIKPVAEARPRSVTRQGYDRPGWLGR